MITVSPRMVSSDYQFNYGPQVYYSSAWTGITSKEEQRDIALKKLISDQVKNHMEKEIENFFLFGTMDVREL